MQAHIFGEVLRRYRRAAGLTQEELAERAHLSARAISDLERGRYHVPRRDSLALLVQALQLDDQDRAVLQAAARRSPAGAAAPAHAVSPLPPFVGRTPELALVDRHLGGAGPPLLLLAGEPGIGKSRLLQVAAARAPDKGLRTLAGSCQRQGGHSPYSPLLEALQRYLEEMQPAELHRALRGCAWLVRMLPELADGPIDPLPHWVLSPQQEHRLMVAAVLRFLGNVAGPAGTLLVLDDLQWASPDALDLLGTLVRAAVGIPLRVIGAYRDTDLRAPDALSVLLTDLAHARLTTRRVLTPLSPAEAAQLLDGLLAGARGMDAARRNRVLERAGGVPFFVESCAHALRAEAPGAEGGDAVPWDVEQSVRQRMAALPRSAHAVLRVAAILGRVVAPLLLTAASGRPEEEVLEALELACQARLLVADADCYRFAHDVIREVLEADLGPARRLLLHRTVADALERQPGEPPLDLLAYHYSLSPDQGKAVQYLEQAGDLARMQAAHAVAESYYRDLVWRLEDSGRVADAGRACEKLGAVLTTAGRYEAALEVLERAAAARRAAGDLEGLGRVTAQICWVYAQGSTPEEGVARVRPLLAALEARGPSPALVDLYVAQARLFVVSGQVDQELAAAARGVALARALGDDRLLAAATGRHGLALSNSGRVEEGVGVLEESARLAERVGDVFTLCRALINGACAACAHGDFERAGQCAARAHAVADQLGDPTQVAAATIIGGVHAFFTGDWIRARKDLERAVELGGRIGTSWVSGEALCALAQVCLGTGAWGEASRYLDQALLGAGRDKSEAQQLLVDLDLLQGHVAAAWERLAPLKGEDTVPTLGRLAWAHLASGDLEHAAAALTRAKALAQAGQSRTELVRVLELQSRMLTRQGCWEEAILALEEGVALARAMPYPYAEARLLAEYGQLHVERGQPEPARERLEAAPTIFRRLGTRKDAERTEQLLAAHLHHHE
jgi:tetratricopeptide (TPR) repeat protein